jgi:hypothetical protein
MMMLLLEPSHALELDVVGGVTESIFMETEAWLLQNSDHQEALAYVASRKTMDHYTSMMDFLFCEIFIDYRGACQRFYRRKGPLLKKMISKEQIAKFDKALIGALKVAYEAFCEKRKMTWVTFRLEAIKLAV